MYHFTVPMALMDFLPVLFFGVTAVLLLRDLYNKMFKGIYALLASGNKSFPMTMPVTQNIFSVFVDSRHGLCYNLPEQKKKRGESV